MRLIVSLFLSVWITPMQPGQRYEHPPPPSFAPHGEASAEQQQQQQHHHQQQQQQQQQPSLFVPNSSAVPFQPQQNQQMQFMPSTFAPPSSNPPGRDDQRNSLDGGVGGTTPPPPQNFQSQPSFQRPEPTNSVAGQPCLRERRVSGTQNTSSSSGQNNKGFEESVLVGGFPDNHRLEELGVDFSQIARRAKSAMNPFSRKTKRRERRRFSRALVVFGLIATLHAIQGRCTTGIF